MFTVISPSGNISLWKTPKLSNGIIASVNYDLENIIIFIIKFHEIINTVVGNIHGF